MKANVKQKKPKIKIGDRVANTLFCEIIDTLIKRYDESKEKETMDFKEYCIFLRDLSIKSVGKKPDTDEKIIEEGEKIE